MKKDRKDILKNIKQLANEEQKVNIKMKKEGKIIKYFWSKYNFRYIKEYDNH